MQDGLAGIVVVPGVVALVLLLVFSFLYTQIRKPYFSCWVIAWAGYLVFTVARAWNFYTGFTSLPLFVTASLASIILGVAVLCSAFTINSPPTQPRLWKAVPLVLLGLMILGHDVFMQLRDGPFNLFRENAPPARMTGFVALLMMIAALRFAWASRQRSSGALVWLASTLAVWSVLLAATQVRGFFWGKWVQSVGHPLGAVPQMLIGLAQMMVLFEDQRREVQENALAFSSLPVDGSRILAAEELTPSLHQFLLRFLAMTPGKRGLFYIHPNWQSHFPCVQQGFSSDSLSRFQAEGSGDYLADFVYRRGGGVTSRDLDLNRHPVSALPGSALAALHDWAKAEHISRFTALSLQTRDHNFGVILVADAAISRSGGLGQGALVGLALQISLTLDHYVAVQAAHRRAKEYGLLTEIGQALATHLDQDSLLLTIYRELGHLLDTRCFYIAFECDEGIAFGLESENGVLVPARTRPLANGFTEYVIRTRSPLLIPTRVEEARQRLGVNFIPHRPAKSLCMVPIFSGLQAIGVLAALNPDREFAFGERDLQIMQTVAGQVSVAMENARLYSEEQRRSRHFSLLNRISELAISSEDPVAMLQLMVGEIHQNFPVDLIAIGTVDFMTKEIEIRAHCGSFLLPQGERIRMGTGLLGRVARTSEYALMQGAAPGQIQSLLPDARSVLCLPLTYSETLLGVLSIESSSESAFVPQDVQVIKTVADLVAAALHNVFVFQKMQQQSMTDGLTGAKTRRFFLEALNQEWKRSARSSRPFSVVMLDLDLFKQVNDLSGHFEGDLVLARVAHLIEQRSRHSNVVARFGGDEFVVLMPETGVEQAVALAERLRQWLAVDPLLAEHRVTASIGVASFPLHGLTAEEVMHVADATMYLAKQAGGNRVVKAQELSQDEPAALRRQLISGYVEGFLKRERTGPEDLEDLVAHLATYSHSGNEESIQFLIEAIELLNTAAEAREPHGSGHSEHVARYALMIGRELGLSGTELADLTFAARVHDLGKIFVPEKILNKPSMLTDDEFYIMKMHPRVGAQILEVLPGREEVRHAVRHHHEAYDGSGYPDGLKGEQIPLAARIIGISEAFANMISERPFAPARTISQALVELERMSGTRFDGMLTRILTRQIATGSVIAR